MPDASRRAALTSRNVDAVSTSPLRVRWLPLLLIALLVVGGIGLALAVMWRSSAGSGLESIDDPPAYLGGVPQGHVYTGVAEEPSDVNPFTTSDHVARRLVLAYTHEALLDREQADGSLRPALAESYEVSADGTTCTFTLREGVVFSDGSPLTMADVMFGWELAQAGHLPLGFVGAAFGRVADVDVLDERRLRVHFRERHFAAVANVGENWLVANRRFFVDRVRQRLSSGEAEPDVASERFAELMRLVNDECGPGTGPYALFNEPGGRSHWRRRQDLLLVRNELSWCRKLRPGTWNFAGVRTVFFRDSAGANTALLRGELDWYSSALLDELLASQPDLAQRYRRLVYDYVRLGVIRIVWNCRHLPLQNPIVRRALGMLVDRDAVVKVFGGAAKPAAAHAKLGSQSYPDVAALPFDPPAARRLLRSAGFDPTAGKPLRLSLLAPNGNEAIRRTAELFAHAARQAGVELDLRQREWSAFVAEKTAEQWDGLLVLQYFNPVPDPHRFLHSEGMANDGAWRDQRADELAASAQVELDAQQRAKSWRELHQIAHDSQPAALIVHPMATILLNADIQGVKPGPIGLWPERAWVAPEKQRR